MVPTTLVPSLVKERVGGAAGTDHHRFIDSVPTYTVHQRFSLTFGVTDDIVEASERVKTRRSHRFFRVPAPDKTA